MKKFIKLKSFRENSAGGYCGPASLKIVLDYYGMEKSEDELAKLCKNSKTLGSTPENLKKVAEKFGFKVEIKEKSTFRDLEKWLDKKVPVIVDWFTRGRSDYTDSDIADGHYSVVCGLDEKFIYLEDPELGKIRKMAKDDFLTVWFDFRGKYIKPEELTIRMIIVIYK